MKLNNIDFLPDLTMINTTTKQLFFVLIATELVMETWRHIVAIMVEYQTIKILTVFTNVI